MKLTREQWHARAEAYREASEHLTMPWTDDEDEMREGVLLSAKLMRKADECFEKGDMLPSNAGVNSVAEGDPATERSES